MIRGKSFLESFGFGAPLKGIDDSEESKVPLTQKRGKAYLHSLGGRGRPDDNHVFPFGDKLFEKQAISL